MDDSGNFFELVRGWYKTAIYSMKRYQEADCGSFRTRIHFVTFYEAQMAEEMPSKTFGNNYPQETPRDWTYPIPKSMDEEVTQQVLSNTENDDYPDITIVVADASNLRRSIFLLTQIIDLNMEVVKSLKQK